MKLLFYSCAFIVLTTTITCCNLNKGNSHQKEDKEIVKKIVTGENMVNVDLMIEDTGVSINHYFVNTNGKWLLTAIKDASD
jgi:hypothetical protein